MRFLPNRTLGKGLKFKKFSGKFWALVCASLLISVSAQATYPEFEDWSFDQDGNFYTSTGRQIKPWDQPQALRQARKLGLDKVQTLLNNSALRIVQCDNGNFVLHLHGRLRGGMKRTGRRLPDGGYIPNFVPHVVITPAPRRPVNKSQSFKYGLDDSSDDDWIEDDGYEEPYIPETQEEKDAHNDRILTHEVSKKVKQNPNTLIVFKEKKRSVRKEQLKKLNIAWDKKLGQKVKGASHYTYSRNSQGNTALKDSRKGIVYPTFTEDRQNTDCYLPRNYPKRSKDYPARDTDLGGWLLNRYTQYKLTFNQAIVGGVGKSFKGPFHRVLSEKRHRTTKPMLATFGLAANTMGPGKLYALGKKLRKTNPNSGPAMMEAAQWLYMFRKPEKYFTVSLEKPIAVFKGESLTHENVPSSIVKRWSRSPHFTKNIQGNLAIQDKRNGLTYTTFISDRRYSDAFLPVGYDYSDRDTQLGGWLIERYVDHKIGLHDVLIGNMEDRIHEIFSEPKHRTNTAILSTFGIVANKMGPGGLRKLSVKLETSDTDLSQLLFEAHQWLGLFKNPNKYFLVNMERPIAQFKGTTIVRAHIPKTIRYELWPKTMQNFKKSLAGTSSLQDPRNGLCYPLYSVNYRNPQVMLPKGYMPTEEHQILGASILEVSGKNEGPLLENVFGIPPQYSRSLLERRKLKALTDLTLTTGLATQTMLENGRLQGNSGFISPRIKEAAVEQLFDAALETTGVGPKLSTAWDFLETRAPQTASLLQTLFNGVTIPLEVAQSLMRKALRTVGVPPIQAQNLVDSTLLVGGLTTGAKALSKLKGKVVKKTALLENQRPYNPHKMKEFLERKYGPLTSSTIPEVFQPNVKLAGKRHPTTGILFDQRVYPVFDKHMKFETRLPKKIYSVKDPQSHMRAATRDLRSQIEKGNVDPKKFTEKQLKQIEKGKEKIDGHTWHHHQDLGRMQLVPHELHAKTTHVGGMNKWF